MNGVLDDGVSGDGISGDEVATVVVLFKSALVRGPVAPYPVVSGVPEQIFNPMHWNDSKAVNVPKPK